MEQSYHHAVSIPRRRLACPTDCATNFLRLIPLVSVWYSVRQTMPSTRNCLQISCSLIYCFFTLPHGIHSIETISCLFPTLRERIVSMDFRVALLIQFALLLVNGGLRDVQQQHRPGVPTGLKYPAWKLVTIYAHTKHMT